MVSILRFINNNEIGAGCISVVEHWLSICQTRALSHSLTHTHTHTHTTIMKPGVVVHACNPSTFRKVKQG
jgi:hypothetical protein